jgi:hypothetical protein
MGVILRSDAGHVVPKGYLEKACTANPGFWGVAFTSGGEIMYQLVGEKPDVGILEENIESFKGSSMLLYLGSAPDDHPEDIRQPFVLLTKDNKEIVLGFLDGDFKNYEDKAQPQLTGECVASEKYLKPKLEKLFRLCNYDVEKLSEEINSDDFETDMDRTYGIHGTIVLILSNNDMYVFSKNNNQQTYDWGWTSQSYDWTGETEPAKTTLQKLKDAVAAKKDSGAAASGNVVPMPPPAPKKEEDDDDDEGENPSNTAPVGRDASNSVLMSPPRHVTKTKQRKRWYRAFAGFVPENHHTCPKVWVVKAHAQRASEGRINGSIKSFRDEAFQAISGTHHPDAGTEAENPPEDTATNATAGVANTDATPQVTDGTVDPGSPGTPLWEKLPVVDPKELVQFKAWHGSADYNNLVKLHQKGIGDPTKFAELESKLPDICKSLGMKSEEILQWTPAMRFYILCNFPTIGAALLDHVIKRYAAELERQDPTPVTAQETPPIAPATKTTVPATGNKSRLLLKTNKSARIPG